jgi:CheY-like chemotaxis protein
MSDSFFSSPPRVLIVDNDQDSVQIMADLVSHWGYVPVCAEGEGINLLEDARRKARERRCQLALVDMRLKDNFDEKDTSGLDLISTLKPAAVLIISGHGNAYQADESRDKGAISFIGKEIDPLDKKRKLQGAAKRICARDHGLNIKTKDMLSSVARTLFDPSVPSECHDQIVDIFVRLFPEAVQLDLEKIGAEVTSSDFSTAPRPRSVVLRVREDTKQPVIVKFARRQKIEEEITHFEQYIRDRLVGNFVPELRGSEILWDIGGMKLKYIGRIQQTFANFFQNEPYEKIERSLKNFFEETWSEHYKNKKPLKDVSLFELYYNVWGKEWYDRVCRTEDPDIARLTGVHLRQNLKEDDTQTVVEWIQHIAANKNSDKDPSKTEMTFTAITHGDLHADNLLIDESQHGWVVDFERTGPGHVLQDFVELESDLITRMSSQRDFRAFYHLCIAAVQSGSIGDIRLDDPLLSDPETQKLLKTISAIRTIALNRSDISDMRQYLFGLFFNAVFRATIIPKEEGNKNQILAWVFADVLFHRLDHWNEPWPPAEWNL